MSNLIRCADGRWAPACILCVHLCDGQSDQWVQLPQPDGGEVFDYLCPECFEKGPDALELDDLRSCCFHCANRLIEERGITPIYFGP
jgi:hypothetical protein